MRQMNIRSSARLAAKRVGKLMEGKAMVSTPSAADIKQTMSETREKTGLIPDINSLIGEMATPTRYYWWTPDYKSRENESFFFRHDVSELEGMRPFNALGTIFTEAEMRKTLLEKTEPEVGRENWLNYQLLAKNLSEMLQICVARGWMRTKLE